MSEKEIEDLLSVVIEDTTIASERLRQYIKDLRNELSNLKEIEKTHQEENGKLRVELEQEKEKNKNTGKLVENKIDGTIGIVLREWETGQIQVLEKIQPKVINTHDSWKTLEVIEDE